MVEKLIERWPLLIHVPGAELVVALIVAVAGAIFGRSYVRCARADRASVPPVLPGTAAAVIAVWLVDLVGRTLWVRFPAIAWWSFALPLVVAALGVGVTALVSTPSVRRKGEPTSVGVRRSWLSFASTSAVWISGVLATLVLITTLFSGSVSSSDEFGRYIFIDFGDAGVATFYGWSYGLPVLAGLSLVTVMTLIALSRISAPPFVSAGSLVTERRARRVVSNAVLSLSAAALALTWGQSLQLVGQAGSGSAGVGIPGVGEFNWSPGYSSFAGIFLWGGWAMEVIAFVILLALIVGAVPFDLAARSSTDRRNEEVRAR
jgi:uncharacterized membrane protein